MASALWNIIPPKVRLAFWKSLKCSGLGILWKYEACNVFIVSKLLVSTLLHFMFSVNCFNLFLNIFYLYDFLLL